MAVTFCDLFGVLDISRLDYKAWQFYYFLQIFFLLSPKNVVTVDMYLWSEAKTWRWNRGFFYDTRADPFLSS